MASSATDSQRKDKDIRQQLVETGHVDVMISVGNNFFYTKSLLSSLWFLDKGKKRRFTGQRVVYKRKKLLYCCRSYIEREDRMGVKKSQCHCMAISRRAQKVSEFVTGIYGSVRRWRF